MVVKQPKKTQKKRDVTSETSNVDAQPAEQHKRKTKRPLKVVQYVQHSERPKTKKRTVSSVDEQEVIRDVHPTSPSTPDSSTPIPSVDFTLEHQISTDYQSEATTVTTEKPTTREDATVTDKMKIFTLLLQVCCC